MSKFSRFTLQSLFFTENEKVINYRDNSGSLDSVHWGQRKLLTGEILLLTKYLTKDIENAIMVVAGGAHGTHYKIIEEMFPDIKQIILYDPSEFRVLETDKIKIVKELFTDDLAREFGAMENVIFLSDIRSVSEGESSPTEYDIDRDMQMQMRWVELMRPLVAMLKYRLPYYDKGGNKEERFKEYPYLKGIVFKQVWNRQKSTEGRLIVERPDGDQEYDKVKTKTTESEDVYFYHNHVARGKRKYYTDFSIPGIGFDYNLDDSYDSIAESAIIYQYLVTLSDGETVYATRENIVAISDYFSRELSQNKDKYLTLRDKRKKARSG